MTHQSSPHSSEIGTICTESTKFLHVLF